MTFSEYLVAVAVEARQEHGWRRGQAAMNVLRRERPELYNWIMEFHHEVDPFHRNKNLPAFYDLVEDAW